MSRRTGSAGLALAAALLLLDPALGAAAEVSFEATVDQPELGMDETLNLRVVLQSSEQPSQISLPGRDMKDFEVVSQSQSSQASFSLGGGGGVQINQSRIFALVLKPKRQGTLTIPPATCTVGGKEYSTKPVTVKVSAAGKSRPPRQPVAPPDDDLWAIPGQSPPNWKGWERDLSLRLELDRKQVWLGEQVTTSLLVTSPIDVIDKRNLVPPPFDGFWTEDLHVPVQQSVRNLNGAPVRVYLFGKQALFPTQAGRLQIAPYRAELAVPASGHGLFARPYWVKRESEPISVEVRPLPKDGVPAGFASTNVGDWRLTAEIAEKQVAAGQPVTYRLIATGHGNVRSLSLPRLPPLSGLKAFDPTVTEKVEIEGDRFGGSKTLETVVVPAQTGELVFPPVEWPFFNTRTGRYETARTPELRVAVTTTAAGASGAPAPGTNTLTAGLRPLRVDREIGKQTRPPWKSPLFAILLVGPILFYAGLTAADQLRERLQRGSGARRTRLAGRMARRRLQRARRLSSGGDLAAFHAEVARALEGYAADKLGRPVAGMTRQELSGALARFGAHPPALDALGQALDACDAGRYGRGAASPLEVLAGAAKAMEMLEEADWKRPEAAV